MDVLWNKTARADWDHMAWSALAPLQQDWSYGAAMDALGADIARAEVRRDGVPIALAQFACRRLGMVAAGAVCTRGPVWLAPLAPHEKARVFRALRRTAPLGRFRIIAFTPNDGVEDMAPKLARMTRIVTGGAGAMLDLRPDEAALHGGLRGKWRNRLRAAKKVDLRVGRCGVKPAQYAWLVKADAGQQEARRFRRLPEGFVAAYQADRGRKDALRIWRADRAGRPIAGMMFLRHGRGAAYHIGWADREARRLGAHNLLLWEAITALRAEGVEALDLGDVDTERNPGLARFKLGAGAAPFHYAGTFV